MTNQEEAFKDESSYNIASAKSVNTQDALQDSLKFINSGKSIVLYGPPGTGKTKLAYDIVSKLKEDGKLGRFQSVQFHHKFTYEDFIEGYAPNDSGGFDKKDGVFKTFISTPSEDDKFDIFLIDEINRADLTTTFGELLFLMEDRDTRFVTTSHFGDELKLPINTIIIGTMNTADKSIANLDFALRRRFTFISLYPDYEAISWLLNERGVEGFDIDEYVTAIKIINGRIAGNRLMGKHMELGNALWVPSGNSSVDIEDIKDIFIHSVIPQVEAYCGYGFEDQLALIFNPNIAQRYLNQKQIQTDDIQGLFNDLNTKSQ